MPVLRSFVPVAPTTGNPGTNIHPLHTLLQHGPLIQVTLGTNPKYNTAYTNSGQAIPGPHTGYALIDTGASNTSVDDAICKKLCPAPINTTSISTPSSANHQCGVYELTIDVLKTQIVNPNANVIGAQLSNQNIVCLLGRDFLIGKTLIYNGTFGDYSIYY